MSYVEKMRERRKTPHAAWHKIRTSIDINKFGFFAVFEGEDDEDFYCHYLRKRNSNMSFRSIISDGKGGLLALYDMLIKKYGSARNVYFFVDADHDALIGIELSMENTFVSDGYSVESYGLNATAITEMVRLQYNLQPIDPIIAEIEQIVLGAVSTFCRRARTLMVYLVCLRRRDVFVDVDRLHFVDAFHCRSGVVRIRKVRCKALLDRLDCHTRIPPAEFSAALRELARMSSDSLIRGKMVSQFLIRLLKELSISLPAKQKINGKPCKARTDLTARNYALEISKVVPESKRLAAFLDQLLDESAQC